MRTAVALLLHTLSLTSTHAFNHHHSFAASRSISLRQHHEPRPAFAATTVHADVCAYISAEVLAEQPLLAPLALRGLVDICLCLSGLRLFLSADVVLGAAVRLLGEPALEALLTVLVRFVCLFS
jgi:hypothetical protein